VRHPSEDEKPIVHRLLQLAFAEHFDFHPLTYDEWLAQGRDRYEQRFSWIASVDGQDAGVVLGRNNRDTMGWVRALGVLPTARGRGVGGALLRLAFAAFADAGRDTLGLGVDTQNVTNALRLYTSLGMGVHFAVDTWERTVPARALAI
jgi:ribosomal protein S18 acetylase RimI-like enzyme